MPTIKLTGNYGYTDYSVSNLAAGTIIDATAASWIVDNDSSDGSENRYPIRIIDSPNVTLLGGAISGNISQTEEWETLYTNSAGIRIEYTANPIIDDWRIDKAWDGIRIGIGTTNFLIDDLYISNTRDDAVENDYMASGIIRDSLFDGVFTGIALDSNESVVGSNHDMSSNTMTIENTLIRAQSYLTYGEMTHGPLIKSEDDNPAYMPNLRFINTVLAIEDVGHMGYGKMATAWANTVEVKNSVFLNLSDTPLPSNYPMPPAGFTVLQGAEARAYWQAAKTAWLDNHDGTPYADVTPLPGTSTSAPVQTAIDGTSKSETLTGTTGADKIYGRGGDDKMNGKGGNDVLSGGSGNDNIYGKGGKDVLTGGYGYDTFIFNTPLGSKNVDTITDFNTRADSIYLDNAIFAKLGSGSLASRKQLSSSWFDDRADDANDYILYDRASGVLSYDADGNGAGAAIQIAQLSPGVPLTYSDIFVV